VNNKVKKIVVFHFLVLQFAPAFTQSILIKNTSVENYFGKVIELSWKEIVRKYNIRDTTQFLLVNEIGKELPIQFEYFEDGSIKKILTFVSIPAKGITRLKIIRQKRSAYSPLVFARYVPERKDDFAWENNKIAFRMYGKALQSTNENAHGIDVWAKRTDKLIINDWYKKSDYHTDYGEGLDFYSVGPTLGAGNIAPYLTDTVYYPGNYSAWKIVSQGPLRLRFKLTYDSFNYKGATVMLEKEIQLSAGDNFNKVTVSLYASEPLRVPMAVGIVRRKEGGDFSFDKQRKLATYWEPANIVNGSIGVGVIFTTGVQFKSMQTQYLFISNMNSLQKLIYYTGAAWDKQGDFKTVLSWKKLTRRFAKEIQGGVDLKIRYQ
jgi:hypothetical protein